MPKNFENHKFEPNKSLIPKNFLWDLRKNIDTPL